MRTAHYILLPPQKSRGRILANKAELLSKRFVKAYIEEDRQRMEAYSTRGWASIQALSSYFRNEQDYGRISDALMGQSTARIWEKTSSTAVQIAIETKRLDKLPSVRDATLREALNKIAHVDLSKSAYRVAGTGAHFLILTGPEQKGKKGFWIIEIHVAKLCRRCREAVGQGKSN